MPAFLPCFARSLRGCRPFVLVAACVLGVFWPATGRAQLLGVQWDAGLGGNGNDHCTVVRPTRDGGYLCGGIITTGPTGLVTQPARGLRDYWVVKVDSLGAKQWDRTFGGAGYDDFSDLQQTADGGYILAGTSTSEVSGDKTQPLVGASDFWVVKLDAAGTKQWDRTFGGLSSDYLYQIRQTPDGGYLLGGSSFSGVGGDKSQPQVGDADFWVVRLGPQGQKLWDRTYGGNQGDYPARLELTRDGGSVLAGFSGSTSSGDKTLPGWGGGDFWVVKLDALGNKQWDGTYGGSSFERLSDVHQTADGGYLLGGSSSSGVSGTKSEPNRNPAVTNPTDYDFWVVKLDAAGGQQWDRTWGTAATDELSVAQPTPDGGYLMAGTSVAGVLDDKTTPNRGLGDMWVLKISAAGAKQWDLGVGGSGFDQCGSVVQGADGRLLLGGNTASGRSGDKSQSSWGLGDFWLVKIGPPRVRILGDREVCNGGQVRLSALASPTGTTYAWSTGATTASILVAQPGTYTVTATFPNGQTSTAQHPVAGRGPLQLLPGDSVVCPGRPLTLAVPADGTGYTWNTGATTANIIVTQPGMYAVTVSYGGGCSLTAQRTVRSPAVQIRGGALLCADQGGTGTLEAVAPGAASVRWSTGATTPTVTVTQAGAYAVTATYPGGCTAMATHVVSAPTARIAGDSVLCTGRPLVLTAGGTVAAAYRWSTGAGGATLAVFQPGTYSVVATFTAGCTSTAVWRVRAGAVGPLAWLGTDTTLCDGESLVLRVPQLAGASYLWSTGATTPELRVAEAGTYAVVVRTACETVTLRRRVVLRSCAVLPNVVTANGDGRNDAFAPTGLVGAWSLAVYNRWGRRVYETDRYQNGWGGEAAAGQYFYVLRQEASNQVRKGWVEVIR